MREPFGRSCDDDGFAADRSIRGVLVGRVEIASLAGRPQRNRAAGPSDGSTARP